MNQHNYSELCTEFWLYDVSFWCEKTHNILCVQCIIVYIFSRRCKRFCGNIIVYISLVKREKYFSECYLKALRFKPIFLIIIASSISHFS